MTNIQRLIDKNTTMTALQTKQLTQVIENMIVEFNQDNDEEVFGLHDLYMNDDNELEIVCMEEMTQQSMALAPSIMAKLNTPLSQSALEEIEAHIKVEIM
ncbi:hypothetical protein [Staphylococcus pettenkoferi]|uniref:hypothetical protein n=2 Tax=Bacilli TaxID=91061 RepID=UPI002553F977|nr:hypothetical protein [Staphylococcus pettenkoferi]MDK7284456.1 hypothetical protein [Staphylococcus pettenkoferi]